MALSFREWPWPVQGIFFLGFAVVLIVIGLFMPYSPIRDQHDELKALEAQKIPLQDEVRGLEVYKQRRAELQGKMESLEKELATLQTIVPEEKETDQFILMLQGAAAASNVSIRRLTAKPIATKEYHYEMPFEVEADAPYYAMLDFYGRLGRLSRIINIGDIDLKSIGDTPSTRFRLAPGTSVTGTFVVTTFFTKMGGQAAGAGPGPGSAPEKK